MRDRYGFTALHRLCQSGSLSAASEAICAALLETNSAAAHDTVAVDGIETRSVEFADTALHLVCRAVPHSQHSLALCKKLIAANEEVLTQKGAAASEDEGGAEPLLDVLRQDMYTAVTSDIAELLARHCPSYVPDALVVLNSKVYQPHGDEKQQMLALRVVISLAFCFPEAVVKFIKIDIKP